MTQCLLLPLLFLLFPLISYGKPQQANSQFPCICQRWQDCTWSQNLLNQIAVLPKDHQNYQPFTEQFKAQICDQKTRHVWCCGGFEKDLTIGQESRTMGKKTPSSYYNLSFSRLTD